MVFLLTPTEKHTPIAVRNRLNAPPDSVSLRRARASPAERAAVRRAFPFATAPRTVKSQERIGHR